MAGLVAVALVTNVRDSRGGGGGHSSHGNDGHDHEEKTAVKPRKHQRSSTCQSQLNLRYKGERTKEWRGRKQTAWRWQPTSSLALSLPCSFQPNSYIKNYVDRLSPSLPLSRLGKRGNGSGGSALSALPDHKLNSCGAASNL